MIVVSGAHRSIAQGLISLLKDKKDIFTFTNSAGSIIDLPFLEQTFAATRPSIFINCEEYDNIDEAEYWRGVAYEINSLGVKNLARLCTTYSTLLVHISSAYIFDGSKPTPYQEDAIPAPQTVYGDSKLLGEKFISELTPEHLIIRIPDNYSKETMLLNPALGYLHEKTIHCLSGQRISPLSSSAIVHSIVDLIEKNARGVLHLAPNDSTSTEDFLREALNLHNLHADDSHKIDYLIEPLTAHNFLTPADRPLYNVLDNNACQKYTDRCNVNWKEDLTSFFASTT